MELQIIRDDCNEQRSLGQLFVDGAYFCETCEDAERDVKIQGETAIPIGRYPVTIDLSARFGRRMLHILDVPNFAGIRIHGGNSAADTAGCPLVGKVRTKDGVAVCAPVLADLFAKVDTALKAGDQVWITIHNKPST